MKTFLSFIAISAMFAVGIYGLTVFITWDYDISKFSTEARFTMASVWALIICWLALDL